ncbi:5-oxoprolinase subunit A OS=Tsukamurella paurometabola (strain ATCC 8368 / DSM / CCUG 35730/ CIP 100753 / JCM 10117 / KCTC 9821 / NBRC 16120 / NCIMB 702349/ NCTC 13040) OX=521096 GN=pxpA PE=3 SV=1 [Tsukamurella paurometabola]|uniref:5-oxoprolinase subunit A n=1 Tax=Tsukamurella paurometabola (strain ATCC 8368 / DSM 20162 / CCUG 35730 / CIP 100753 / JCM 10117 / KCTC 9821 / NBRC 16120 / NCIMB 702349 / NCTC 13040) TaxID=521096 RepID=D5USV9_TSUPD|nr:5-oxoprolinase subunit PxpA [Tsukamurella paurometabola]ADG77246.1 LamB/YcsF family protein [Tsukamurella paurometabola DSM 20162]SUP43271.1 LamB/YcsF family protein [Tsukamurella paurometabola]
MTQRIDLNADCGESYGAWRLGDDDALLGIVSSANVACGFHAGDPSTLRATCARAVEQGVRIGAQVGYADVRGFGRRFIEVPPADLTADVIYQIGALQAIARSVGGEVTYVKPHGALYNAIVGHTSQARAVVDGVLACTSGLPVLGLPGSEFLRIAAEQGLHPVAEAFADRAYTPEGTLVPRSHPGSVLHDPDEIAARVVRMVFDDTVEAIDGTEVELHADSVCLHGDNPEAVRVAARLRTVLEGAGAEIAPFN